jgi:protein phosphatase inhibitor 2
LYLESFSLDGSKKKHAALAHTPPVPSYMQGLQDGDGDDGDEDDDDDGEEGADDEPAEWQDSDDEEDPQDVHPKRKLGIARDMP